MYTINTNLTVDNCLFERNKAMGTSGGVMFLSCSFESVLPCSYDIKNSNFTLNFATISGGAIKYDFYKPASIEEP